MVKVALVSQSLRLVLYQKYCESTRLYEHLAFGHFNPPEIGTLSPLRSTVCRISTLALTNLTSINEVDWTTLNSASTYATPPQPSA